MSRKYWAWNLTKDDAEFQLLVNRIRQDGHLHQGWGLAGMDLRLPLSSFVGAWVRAGWPNANGEATVKYNQLQKIRDIQIGDCIVVQDFVKDSLKRVSCGFTICECTAPYGFQPIGSRQDYGHFIGISVGESYTEFDSGTSLGKSLMGLRKAVIPIVAQNLKDAVETLWAYPQVVKKAAMWSRF